MTPFKRKTQILLVCTENICRSPMAEGVLKRHLQNSALDRKVKVRSAGTRTSRPGCKPDQRAMKVASAAGINLGRIRARRISANDFVHTDYILAMDHSNVMDLKKACPAEHQHKIRLLLSHMPGQNPDEVPDPYYGSYEGFVKVFELIESAVAHLIPHIGISE